MMMMILIHYAFRLLAVPSESVQPPARFTQSHKQAGGRMAIE